MAKDRNNVDLKQGDEVMLRGKVRTAAAGESGANVEVELIGGKDGEKAGSFAINSSYATRVAQAASSMQTHAAPAAPPQAPVQPPAGQSS